MLSTPAFNALLKTLEEPPPKSLFVFCTTDPDKIPETVQSRCQRYDLRRIPTAEVAARLRAIADAEKIAVSEASLLAVARAGDGSLRDALTLLDQLHRAAAAAQVDDARVAEVLDLIDRALLTAIARACIDGDAAARARSLPPRLGARASRRSGSARRCSAPSATSWCCASRPAAGSSRARTPRSRRSPSWPRAPKRRACAACSARCCASRKISRGRPIRSRCSRWPWCAARRSRPATRWRRCSRASTGSSAGSPAAAASEPGGGAPPGRARARGPAAARRSRARRPPGRGAGAGAPPRRRAAPPRRSPSLRRRSPRPSPHSPHRPAAASSSTACAASRRRPTAGCSPRSRAGRLVGAHRGDASASPCLRRLAVRRLEGRLRELEAVVRALLRRAACASCSRATAAPASPRPRAAGPDPLAQRRRQEALEPPDREPGARDPRGRDPRDQAAAARAAD